MKKNVVPIALIIISCSLLTAISLLNIAQINPNKVYGNTPYTLLLNDSQRITTSSEPSENEISGNVYTTMNNQITLSGLGVVNNNSGWQTLLPQGYIYNLVSNIGNNNKISGIKSIQYLGNNSLELHYGYSINNEEILYSFSETLAANMEYEFEDEFPSYFYLKNNNNTNVNINELIIKYSCNEEKYPRNNLKVLMIGNSFADDTVYYSERVASSLGIDLELHDAYIGGCTLNTHYSNILSNSASYSMRSMNGASWVYRNDMSLSDIVTSNTWDIITFQQASAEVGRHDSFSNLENLVNEVKSIATGNPKYYWHQTWAYDKSYSDWYDYFSYFDNNQETMFNAIVDCYNDEVASLNIFEKTIFAGTAVQNLRTSYMKDTFSRDGKHMSTVHGRYLLACNFISTIFGIDLDLSPVQFIPEGANQSFLKVVNESIRNAREHPNSITNSVYPNGIIGEYDLFNYTEIDAGLVGCSYYYSQDGSNYNKRINNTKDTSNKFTSTYRFTEDTLPVGSLVFIPEGFGYRPEAWVDDAPQSFRMDEAYDNVLEVTEDFWDGYQYRVFNIFKAGKTPLSDQYVDEQYDQIFDGFRIFVPNNKMAGLTPKSNNSKYEDDKSLFTSNGLDIDDYQRIHLDPITGFYKCDELYYLLNKYVDDTAKKFICTRPFYSVSNDLPEGTVIITDSGYQWRSDCWTSHETYSPRPDNVSSNFYITNSSFMSSFRRRTFNISKTNSSYVGQQAIDFVNHVRIYKPI